MRHAVVLSLLILTLAVFQGCGDKEPVDNTPGDPGKVDVTDNQPPANPGTPPANPAIPTVPGIDTGAMMGKAVLTASCTSCHELEKVTDARKSKEGWAAQIVMCMSETPLAQEKADQLRDYLAKNYGEE